VSFGVKRLRAGDFCPSTVYIVGGNQARLDARSEFRFLAVLTTEGVEAGRKHYCSSQKDPSVFVTVLAGFFQ